MVLYLENLGLTEKLRIFIPQPRQAAERCGQVCGRKQASLFSLETCRSVKILKLQTAQPNYEF